jgi:hypothetical protein
LGVAPEQPTTVGKVPRGSALWPDRCVHIGLSGSIPFYLCCV